MAAEPVNLRDDITHQLALLEADVSDLREFVTTVGNTTEAERLMWSSEWPLIASTWQWLVDREAAGCLTQSQSRRLATVSQTLRSLRSDLERLHLWVPASSIAG